MTQLRARFPWYASLAFFITLLLSAGASRNEVAPQDIPTEKQSTRPSARLQPANDALRHIDRTWFEASEAPCFELYVAVAEHAPANSTLTPARFEYDRPSARAPPAHS